MAAKSKIDKRTKEYRNRKILTVADIPEKSTVDNPDILLNKAVVIKDANKKILSRPDVKKQLKHSSQDLLTIDNTQPTGQNVKDGLKKVITLKTADLKEKFYIAINPNFEIIFNDIVYFNSTQAPNSLNDNAYPNELMDLYRNGAAVHSRFVDMKRSMILGNGLEPVDKNDKLTLDFINHRNEVGDNLNDIVDKLAFSMALFEGGYLQVVYNSLGQISDVYFNDFMRVRASQDNIYGQVEKWFLSRWWGMVFNQRMRRGPVNRPESTVANFNPRNWKADEGRQLMQVKRYCGNNVYPIPSYNTVIPYIKLAYAIGTFELNRALQGFLPSTLVYVPGMSDPQEQDDFINNFNANMIGVQAQKVIFMFGETTDAVPKIEKFDSTEKESVMEKLVDICNEQISIAHCGSVEMAGMQTRGSSSLGGDVNKLSVNRSLFISNYITPSQRIITDAINRILEVNGLGKVMLSNDMLRVTPPMQNPADLTRTERRHMLFGLAPLPEDIVKENAVVVDDAQNSVDPNNIEGIGQETKGAPDEPQAKPIVSPTVATPHIPQKGLPTP
jgi:hypothetical protein